MSIIPPPPGYEFVDWDKLYGYLGRAVIGRETPYVSTDVARYLRSCASKLNTAAEFLERKDR